MKTKADNIENKHSHDPENLRNELCRLLDSYKPKIEYLSAAVAPLTSVATSTTILTFISVQLFLRTEIPPVSRLLAGLNIILLLIMAFVSLIIQIMIANAKLRFARIAHDRIEYKDFTAIDLSHVTKLSHLGHNSTRIIDRIQWLYLNGFFSFLYTFIIITIGILILLMLEQIF